MRLTHFKEVALASLVCSRSGAIDRERIPEVSQRYRDLAEFKQALYGPTFITVKTHQTLHMGDALRNTGNLRHSWTFTEERENGEFKRIKKNNKNDSHFWSSKTHQDTKFLEDLIEDSTFPKTTDLKRSHLLSNLVSGLDFALTEEQLTSTYSEIGTITFPTFRVKRNDFVELITGEIGRVMYLLSFDENLFVLLRDYKTRDKDTEILLQTVTPTRLVRDSSSDSDSSQCSLISASLITQLVNVAPIDIDWFVEQKKRAHFSHWENSLYSGDLVVLQ